MQFLQLVKPDFSQFELAEVERAFRSHPHFQDVRISPQGEDRIDCKFVEANDWTLIHLTRNRQAISISNTRDAALRSVLVIQQALGIPLRLYNDSYTFDLTFSEIATIDELEAAMENSRTA